MELGHVCISSPPLGPISVEMARSPVTLLPSMARTLGAAPQSHSKSEPAWRKCPGRTCGCDLDIPKKMSTCRNDTDLPAAFVNVMKQNHPTTDFQHLPCGQKAPGPGAGDRTSTSSSECLICSPEGFPSRAGSGGSPHSLSPHQSGQWNGAVRPGSLRPPALLT